MKKTLKIVYYFMKNLIFLYMIFGISLIITSLFIKDVNFDLVNLKEVIHIFSKMLLILSINSLIITIVKMNLKNKKRGANFV